ncbi:MAG: tetratricopeptide repeat-containing sensor histidine kinase, partial [Bacteroidales bacterium]|nr:tetratricopeptide repeat-containing sensor histidine kinase [Bacteroidales bacterium]
MITLLRLSIILIFLSQATIFAADWQQSDSLKGLIASNAVKDDQQFYNICCAIAEESADADEILHFSNEAIRLAEKLNINPARPYLLKGVSYLNTGKLALALEYFTKSANEYIRSKTQTGLASAYLYIAEAYSMQDNHNNEKLYLKKAIDIFRDEGDSVSMATALHNLGYASYNMGQYDTALVIFQHTGDIYKRLGHSMEYAYCIGNSGLVYSRMNELGKAEHNLLYAIEQLNRLGDEYAVPEYMIEYAAILQQKGQLSKAIEVAGQSYAMASENDHIELMRDAAYRLSRLYMDMGKYDSACHFQELFISYNDSVKNYRNVQQMADLRTEFEVAQKQSEVDVLEKNRIILRIIIISLITILLLAGGLILLYYINLKKLRRLTSDLEERQRQLEEQREELKELNRIKDKFFSVISHDLRSPISSIGGISHLIKESLEQNNLAMLTEITGYIDQTVFSLTGLLENLLNWAQSQQGKFPYSEEKLDLREIIGGVVKLFASVSLVKNIQVKLKIKPGLLIRGDRNSLMMIIRNLLSNAIKFTPQGGMITITGDLAEDGGVKIAVTDSGIGIPEERIPWLFEFRENKSTYGTEKEKGVGLGLTLVNEFVKLNKGTIEVNSTVGKGTIFTLLFPVYK